MDANDNATLAATYTNVSPVGGVIEIGVALGSGNTTGAHLNSVDIAENP